ncbi:MAG: hypothetical protein QF535_16065 [Anaerolineales bacterium]|nr:hypothetical protein [Anaerolineales bacterium]
MSYLGKVSAKTATNADIDASAAIDATKLADGLVTNAELNTLDVTTQGTAEASKVVTSDGSLVTNFADGVVQRPEIKDYAETANAIGGTGGGTQDIDLTLGNVVSATVDTSTNTFTFSNPSATGKACSFTLILTNGGSQTVNWPASVDWAGGSAPSLTSSGIDALVFTTIDGGTIWYGFLAGADLS